MRHQFPAEGYRCHQTHTDNVLRGAQRQARGQDTNGRKGAPGPNGTPKRKGPSAGSALRYYKLFNATGNTELRQFEADNEHKVLDYLKSISPDTDFPKGKFVNNIKKVR